jgi:hypothetical protein
LFLRGSGGHAGAGAEVTPARGLLGEAGEAGVEDGLVGVLVLQVVGLAELPGL